MITKTELIATLSREVDQLNSDLQECEKYQGWKQYRDMMTQRNDLITENHNLQNKIQELEITLRVVRDQRDTVSQMTRYATGQ